MPAPNTALERRWARPPASVLAAAEVADAAGPLANAGAGRAARDQPRRPRRIARAGADEEVAQVERIPLKRRVDFQHHVILVQLREHGGDFALAVSVVERLVDASRA